MNSIENLYQLVSYTFFIIFHCLGERLLSIRSSSSSESSITSCSGRLSNWFSSLSNSPVMKANRPMKARHEQSDQSSWCLQPIFSKALGSKSGEPSHQEDQPTELFTKLFHHGIASDAEQESWATARFKTCKFRMRPGVQLAESQHQPLPRSFRYTLCLEDDQIDHWIIWRHHIGWSYLKAIGIHDIKFMELAIECHWYLQYVIRMLIPPRSNFSQSLQGWMEVVSRQISSPGDSAVSKALASCSEVQSVWPHQAFGARWNKPSDQFSR